MGVKIQGMEAVTAELKRIKDRMAPAIGAAVKDAGEYGTQQAVDAIYQRYGFRDRSYVAQHFSLSFDTKTLQSRISARKRATSLTRFAVSPHSKNSVNGKSVPAGYTISVLRNEPTWWKGAFMFVGRNGNVLMAARDRGDNSWRKLKGHVKYGPSVAVSFGVLMDEIEPPIIKYLRERYHYHSN